MRKSKREVRIYRLTLANGTTFEIVGKPKFWKSALMQIAPYGSDFSTATFECLNV